MDQRIKSDALRRYRLSLGVFVLGLVLSGLTAFPLLPEIAWLHRHLPTFVPDAARGWLDTVYVGMKAAHGSWPWMAYGTDWLAFGHLVIAIFFVPAFPGGREAIPILRCGVAACVLVMPTAMVCGQIRGIPWAWRAIDCSFGVLGVVPLLYCLRVVSDISEKRATKENTA